MSRAGQPDWLVIARREFLERVRTPWFIVVTLLGPVLMLATILVPALLGQAVDNSATIVVVDQTAGQRVAPILAEQLAPAHWKVEVAAADTAEAALLARIRAEQIDGFVTVPADAVTGRAAIAYHGANAANDAAMRTLYQAVAQAVLALRATDAGIPPDKLAALLAPVGFAPRHTTGEAGGASGAAAQIVGFVVMFTLYLAIILYAVNVLRSVVQEKTNRIVEIMVAAAKPHALMLGKILGVGAVGLVQVAIWVAMALATMRFRGEILGVFGVAAGGWNVPALRPVDVAVILAYFLLGYFFYAAIYAAVGAMVSSEQEAQQAQTPVAMLLVIPVLCVQLVAGHPRGGAAQLLTMVPFSSPVLMPMRWLLGGATTGELFLSLGILALSTLVLARLAARIYRVGILLYGKRPSLRELWRWLRY